MFGIVIAVVNLVFFQPECFTCCACFYLLHFVCIDNSDAVLAEAVHMAFVSEQEMQASLLAVHIHLQ